MGGLGPFTRALGSAFTLAPEFQEDDAYAESHVEALLHQVPPLMHFSDYVGFLRATGGAHIHDRDVSLGVYGFGGHVVAALDEAERTVGAHFVFGDILLLDGAEQALAFDLEDKQGRVCIANFEDLVFAQLDFDFMGVLRCFGERRFEELRRSAQS